MAGRVPGCITPIVGVSPSCLVSAVSLHPMEGVIRAIGVTGTGTRAAGVEVQTEAAMAGVDQEAQAIREDRVVPVVQALGVAAEATIRGRLALLQITAPLLIQTGPLTQTYPNQGGINRR